MFVTPELSKELGTAWALYKYQVSLKWGFISWLEFTGVSMSLLILHCEPEGQ